MNTKTIFFFLYLLTPHLCRPGSYLEEVNAEQRRAGVREQQVAKTQAFLQSALAFHVGIVLSGLLMKILPTEILPYERAETDHSNVILATGATGTALTVITLLKLKGAARTQRNED